MVFAISISAFAKGIIPLFPQFLASAVDDDARAAEVIAEHITCAIVLAVAAAAFESYQVAARVVEFGVADTNEEG